MYKDNNPLTYIRAAVCLELANKRLRGSSIRPVLAIAHYPHHVLALRVRPERAKVLFDLAVAVLRVGLAYLKEGTGRQEQIPVLGYFVHHAACVVLCLLDDVQRLVLGVLD